MSPRFIQAAGLGLVLSLIGGCVVGPSVGGACSTRSSPAPRPGGAQLRLQAGAGWGTRHGTLTALGGINMAHGGMFSAGAELSVAPRPWTPTAEDTHGGFAVVGRVLHGRRGDVRLTELALGPGGGCIARNDGPCTFAVYATAGRMTDELGRVGWSFGLELSFTAPFLGKINSIIEEAGQ